MGHNNPQQFTTTFKEQEFGETMCDEVAQFKGAAQFKGHLEDVRLSSCRCYTRPGIDACGELIPEVVPVLIITLNTSAD